MLSSISLSTNLSGSAVSGSAGAKIRQTVSSLISWECIILLWAQNSVSTFSFVVFLIDFFLCIFFLNALSALYNGVWFHRPSHSCAFCLLHHTGATSMTMAEVKGFPESHSCTTQKENWFYAPKKGIVEWLI